jgi:hypothetical protein
MWKHLDLVLALETQRLEDMNGSDFILLAA